MVDMGRTKKVGTSGRFGARYGNTLKMLVANIEKVQRQKHMCPNCRFMKVRRLSSGIWECKKCHTKFAGGAYYPKSEKKANVL